MMKRLIALALLLSTLSAQAAYETGSADQVLVVPHAGGRSKYGQVDLSQSAAVKNVLPTANGGTAVSSSSTAGNVLYSNGTNWVSATLDSPNMIRNVSITGVASTTLVIALKQSDGSSDCSASSPCMIGFRNAAATTGGYSAKSFTAAQSLTIATSDSLGVTAGVDQQLYVYAVSDTTSELCASFKRFDESVLTSATAISTSQTDATVLYCTNAHTSKPIRLLGVVRATWSNPAWGSLTNVALIPFAGGSVSSEDTIPRIEHADVTNLPGGSATCTASNMGTNSHWLNSCTSPALGKATMTFHAGIWSQAPVCVCSTNSSAGDRICNVDGGSTTSVTVLMADDTGSASNQGFHVVCIGSR